MVFLLRCSFSPYSILTKPTAESNINICCWKIASLIVMCVYHVKRIQPGFWHWFWGLVTWWAGTWTCPPWGPLFRAHRVLDSCVIWLRPSLHPEPSVFAAGMASLLPMAFGRLALTHPQTVSSDEWLDKITAIWLGTTLAAFLWYLRYRDPYPSGYLCLMIHATSRGVGYSKHGSSPHPNHNGITKNWATVHLVVSWLG